MWREGVVPGVKGVVAVVAQVAVLAYPADVTVALFLDGVDSEVYVFLVQFAKKGKEKI